MKDQLFMLRPGFHADGRDPLYCGDSVSVEGFLSYFPHLREVVDVIDIDAARPRQEIVALLGVEHQSAPVLVLGDKDDGEFQGVKLAENQRFIDDPGAIRAYLSARYGVAEAA